MTIVEEIGKEILSSPTEKAITAIAFDANEQKHEVRVGYAVFEHWFDKQKIIHVFDIQKDLTIDYNDLIFDIVEAIHKEEGMNFELEFV